MILLVVAFGLAFGGQTFDTVVNVPLFFGDPPASIKDPRMPDGFIALRPEAVALVWSGQR